MRVYGELNLEAPGVEQVLHRLVAQGLLVVPKEFRATAYAGLVSQAGARMHPRKPSQFSIRAFSELLSVLSAHPGAIR